MAVRTGSHRRFKGQCIAGYQSDLAEHVYVPPLVLDPPQSPQVSDPSSYVPEDVKPKTLPLDKNVNHQIESPGERRK